MCSFGGEQGGGHAQSTKCCVRNLTKCRALDWQETVLANATDAAMPVPLPP